MTLECFRSFGHTASGTRKSGSRHTPRMSPDRNKSTQNSLNGGKNLLKKQAEALFACTLPLKLVERTLGKPEQSSYNDGAPKHLRNHGKQFPDFTSPSWQRSWNPRLPKTSLGTQRIDNLQATSWTDYRRAMAGGRLKGGEMVGE